MALAATDIEQVKTIVTEIITEMWKERQNVVPITPSPDGNNRKLEQSENDIPVASSSSPDENNRKFELLERIIRVEEELKYLREDTKRLHEDMKQLREDMRQQREDMRQLREDMNRQLKIVLWVVSGWGGLIGLLVTASTLYS